MKKIFLGFIALSLLLSLLGLISPVVALLLGLTAGLLFGNPVQGPMKSWSTKLLQLSVVGLGFGLPLEKALESGIQGFWMTLASLVFVFGLGWILHRYLKCEGKVGLLVTAGTAICGGSAIAALAPAIKTSSSDTSLALAVVFVLNAVGLLVFPYLGLWLGMESQAFGWWAALAIHDTSSVVGAATAFDEARGTMDTLPIAATVKLTRALWIIPVTLIAGWAIKKDAGAGKMTFPWFILGFVAAIVLAWLFPSLDEVWMQTSSFARRLLVAVLVLIGAGLTRDKLAKIGLKPLAFGVLLWLATAIFTFFLLP